MLVQKLADGGRLGEPVARTLNAGVAAAAAGHLAGALPPWLVVVVGGWVGGWVGGGGGGGGGGGVMRLGSRVGQQGRPWPAGQLHGRTRSRGRA